MKFIARERGLALILVVMLGLLLASCGGSPGSVGRAGAQEANIQGLGVADPAGEAAGALAATPRGFSGPWHTSGSLVGLPVVADDGAEIGHTLEVLFAPDGQLRYVILDAGAYLGVEERVTMLRWSDLQTRPAGPLGYDAMRPEHTVLLYDGGADGLRADAALDSAALRERSLLIDNAAVGLEGVGDALIRMSNFEDFDLDDYRLELVDGDIVGDVEELIVNLDEGAVRYAVVETGGMLGVSKQMVAVPWERLRLDHRSGTFTLPVTAAAIQQAPLFDFDAIEESGFGQGWYEEIDSYWAEIKDVELETPAP